MMTDLAELSRRAAAADSRGGKRPGAGRPRKDGSKPAQNTQPAPFEVRTTEQVLQDGPPPPLIDDSTDMGAVDFKVPDAPGLLYAGAKARKEAAHAAKAELEFRIKAGQYLPREAIRSAIAKAFQSVAQSLRSIPDNLERRLGISPEIAESVGIAIDETMGDLAHDLEQLFIEQNAISAKD